jgi:hypothetical protein
MVEVKVLQVIAILGQTYRRSFILAVVLILALVFIVLLLLYLAKLSTTRHPSTMSVNVKWGRERARFDLPDPNTILGTIRMSIADYTHLPLHSFKLVHAGAVMKDDNAPS